EDLARALAVILLGKDQRVPPPGRVSEADQQRLQKIATDLKKAAGRSIVVAGDFQPAAVHALALHMNRALGNLGRTVFLADPALQGPTDPVASLSALVADMEQGKVELLVILGTNPAFDAPADLAFVEKLARVPLLVHLGRYDDETAGHCHWHVPEAHSLEQWS